MKAESRISKSLYTSKEQVGARNLLDGNISGLMRTDGDESAMQQYPLHLDQVRIRAFQSPLLLAEDIRY
jgi:hypothetical protein